MRSTAINPKGERYMKQFARTCAAILMAFGLLQAQNGNLVKVHFATPVTAGVTELPAGDVTIQPIEIGADTISLLVRSASGPQTTVLVNRISRSADSRRPDASVDLVRKGDTYILDEVWVSDTQGFQVIR
jgi:hypothetical protein